MMARIEEIRNASNGRPSVHGEVEATYSIYMLNGTEYLQIDTYGSPARQMPAKVSQSIQLGPTARQKLRAILDQFK
jgi:hypothetical protein